MRAWVWPRRFVRVTLQGHVTHLAAAMARTEESNHLILWLRSVAKSEGPTFVLKTRHICLWQLEKHSLTMHCARQCNREQAGVPPFYILGRSN